MNSSNGHAVPESVGQYKGKEQEWLEKLVRWRELITQLRQSTEKQGKSK